MASAVTDIRQCERWRGEILREISRKVSKIQDAGLTEYEVRDLNDEINKLLREKHHWETQIINLGGANYKRAAPKMLTADGKEVPGMRGYKYFGRAKELPGVKELFEQTVAEQSELESYKNQRVSIFSSQGPDYYGDADEQDGKLLIEERQAEEEDWVQQYGVALEVLGLPKDTPIPPLPRGEYVALHLSASADPDDDADASASTGDKRKATDGADDVVSSKKARGQDGATGAGHRFLTVLKVEDLRPPNLPSAKEIEDMILARQKSELLKEYVG